MIKLFLHHLLKPFVSRSELKTKQSGVSRCSGVVRRGGCRRTVSPQNRQNRILTVEAII
jgi:hypothetical protein